MDNTIILQGRFTGTGNDVIIPLRSGVEWMEVWNFTQIGAAQTDARAVQWYWQVGMPAAQSVGYLKAGILAADNLMSVIPNTFFLFDQSANPVGALEPVDDIDNGNPPIVTALAHGLQVGDVVRMINVAGGLQVSAMDFTVGNDTLTVNTFSLDYMQPIIAAAGPGNFRWIKFQPLFYPRYRFITDITLAARAVITLSVTHGYEIGQQIRVYVPAIFGMTEMNGLLATITDVDLGANTIEVDIDSTAFTPFVFPLTGDVPFTSALVVPVGEDTSFALAMDENILSDATENVGVLGMRLTAGDPGVDLALSGPAGNNGDVMFWKAGVSFSVDNE